MRSATRSRSRLALGAALLLALAAAAYLLLAPAGPEVRVAQITRGSVTARFLAPGEVMARRLTVAAPDWAMINEVLVKEDQHVKMGQPLVRLDAGAARSRLLAARSALESARSRQREVNYQRTLRMGQIEAELERALAEERQAAAKLAGAERGPSPGAIRRAQAGVRSAAAELERIRLDRKRLEAQVSQGAGSRDDLARVRLSERVAEAHLMDAEGQLALVSAGPARASVDQARAELDRAHAVVRSARVLQRELPILEERVRAASVDMGIKARDLSAASQAVQATTLLAPATGLVAQKLLDVGDRAGPGQPILLVVGDQKPWIEASVDEQDAGYVSSGQIIKVRITGLGGRVFPGRVTRVAPSLETPQRAAGSAKFLRVQVELKDKVEGLKAGMAVDVEGSVVLAEQALLLPRAAVLQGSDGPYVLGVDRGRVLRVPVKLGVAGTEHVQLLAGPAEGMTVVVEGAEGLTEGQRIRAMR